MLFCIIASSSSSSSLLAFLQRLFGFIVALLFRLGLLPKWRNPLLRPDPKASSSSSSSFSPLSIALMTWGQVGFVPPPSCLYLPLFLVRMYSVAPFRLRLPPGVSKNLAGKKLRKKKQEGGNHPIPLKIPIPLVHYKHQFSDFLVLPLMSLNYGAFYTL